jgi:hypothetical protein
MWGCNGLGRGLSVAQEFDFAHIEFLDRNQVKIIHPLRPRLRVQMANLGTYRKRDARDISSVQNPVGAIEEAVAKRLLETDGIRATQEEESIVGNEEL